MSYNMHIFSFRGYIHIHFFFLIMSVHMPCGLVHLYKCRPMFLINCGNTVSYCHVAGVKMDMCIMFCSVPLFSLTTLSV